MIFFVWSANLVYNLIRHVVAYSLQTSDMFGFVNIFSINSITFIKILKKMKVLLINTSSSVTFIGVLSGPTAFPFTNKFPNSPKHHNPTLINPS